MAKLVLITGLQRGNPISYDTATASGIYSTGEDGPAAVNGFKIKSALGRQYSFDSTAVKATLTDGALTFTANYAGTYGNNITVDTALGSSGSATTVVTTWAATTGYPTILITVPSGTRADAAAQALNSDPVSTQLITASYASASALVTNISATALSTGTNGSTLDAEPPYGVAGEPIYLRVTDKVTLVVDVQDRVVQRSLQRNNWRYISLGAI
jgi:hypothetical protein